MVTSYYAVFSSKVHKMSLNHEAKSTNTNWRIFHQIKGLYFSKISMSKKTKNNYRLKVSKDI